MGLEDLIHWLVNEAVIMFQLVVAGLIILPIILSISALSDWISGK